MSGITFDVLPTMADVLEYDGIMDGYSATGSWGPYRMAYPAIDIIDWDYRTALWNVTPWYVNDELGDTTIPSDLGADDAMARFRSMTCEPWTGPNPFLVDPEANDGFAWWWKAALGWQRIPFGWYHAQ